MNTPKFLYKLDVGKGDKPINGADSMHLHSTETVFLFLKITIFRKKVIFIFSKASLLTKNAIFSLLKLDIQM